jgi:DNA-binding NarL/FixJ family response regulator
MTRILLVEDHPMVRQGLRLLLGQAGMEVCGEAESRAEALNALNTNPDLLLVDLTLWEESGLDLIRELQRTGAPQKVLVYSMHEDWLHVRQAFQAGAEGYVTKRELSDVLLEAIHTVMAGGIYTSPRALRAVSATKSEVSLEGLALFSAQEGELFHHLGGGLGVGEMAEKMGLSRKTVESYCGRMIVKLNVNGMKELRLVALAQRKN